MSEDDFQCPKRPGGGECRPGHPLEQPRFNCQWCDRAIVGPVTPAPMIRALLPSERADFSECVRFCQQEPLPLNDAETEQRLQTARERWPHIMALLGAWGVQP